MTTYLLVSKDTNLRIKADVLGLATQDYETDKVNLDELYTGTTEALIASAFGLNSVIFKD